ncbi:hypothetical protein [Actinomadura rayongensis]|uniref:Uncharacterized protein n=1 Tax=Actinomadura rayongensis TaxID=1429076 RepID=A0A6I4W6W9_9ACTN|nr:hypothetical protein [Actinomadura rayongensis]MXQ64460.1 hypothetical protein [Actinomadura rayongensis]
MNAWSWWSGEPQRLAPLVLTKWFAGKALIAVPERPAAAPDALWRVQSLYANLRAEGILAAQEPPSFDDHWQFVRDPAALVHGERRGNCLDLSLMFAGMCGAARLRPVIVLLRRPQGAHALVVVPDETDNAALNAAARPFGVTGIARDDDYDKLALLDAIDNKRAHAVDVLAVTDPEGGAAFATALARGRAEIAATSDERVTLVDPLYYQLAGIFDQEELDEDPGDGAEFDGSVAKVYKNRFVVAPERWNAWHITRALMRPEAGGEIARASLLAALNAKAALRAAGVERLDAERLRTVYLWTVGRDPEYTSADVLLVEAASVDVDREIPLALVHFVLGVAAENGTGVQDPAIGDWADRIGFLRADAETFARKYAAELADTPHWALIDFDEESNRPDGELDWTSRTLSVTVEPAVGDVPSRRYTSEEDLADAFAELVADLRRKVAKNRLVVDLVLPRKLLDRRVEHWKVIASWPEKLPVSALHEPRLRWWYHLRTEVGREVQRERERQVGEQAPLLAVPAEHAADDGALQTWLYREEATRAPCLVGGTAGDGCDPLTRILGRGHGHVLWYADDEGASAARVTEMSVRWKRHAALGRDDGLPERLVAFLAPAEKPSVIWNNLNGRGGVRMEDGEIVRGRLEGPEKRRA